MSDLIDKQMAIDAMEKWLYDRYDERSIGAVLNALPSAQPELDEIKIEIDKIYEREGNSVDCLNALDELKWFIDKYKAESEE